MTLLAPAIQSFFTARLITQQAASAETVASYRDAVRLLVAFASTRSGKPPSQLDFADVDHRTVTQFLEHLATDRGNCAATRNARLAAIHALFAASALAHPEHANDIAQVLAIPSQKTTQPEITFLYDDEAEALIAAPDTDTKAGRRDQTMWATAIQTGLRVSELTGMTLADLENAGASPHLTVTGKGRKQRSVPLTRQIADLLTRWIAELPPADTSPVFPNRAGTRLSRDGVEARLKLSLQTAASQCPSLQKKHVTCHSMRHTCAMKLIRAGVDCAVIALWLGHESIETTRIYLHADLALKQQALDRIPASNAIPTRPYKPSDELMAFLQSL
jgi:site-specific recombinase XerD